MCRTPLRRASAAADPVRLMAALPPSSRATSARLNEMPRAQPLPRALSSASLAANPPAHALAPSGPSAPVGPVGARRQLCGGVDPLLEPPAVQGERAGDPLRFHDVEPHSEDHRPLLMTPS